MAVTTPRRHIRKCGLVSLSRESVRFVPFMWRSKVDRMIHQPTAWIARWLPRYPDLLKKTAIRTDVKRMAACALRRRKWMRALRVMGAGKRKAISASLNRRPGLSAGAIHANAMRTRAAAQATAQMAAVATEPTPEIAWAARAEDGPAAGF